MSNDSTRTGYIGAQVSRRFDVANRSDVKPPLPDKMGVEINNSCNHKCYFCQNPTMTRSRTVMDHEMVLRVIQEGIDAVVKKISFYSGGEPFLNRNIAVYVKEAKTAGYEYIYLSSNGGKATSSRILSVLEAGLDSMKFSINAGNREIYKLVHGVDEFDAVIENVQRVADYRNRVNPDLRLFVTFVETDLNKDSFSDLKFKLEHLVDEVVVYPFLVSGTPLKKRTEKDGSERPYIGYDSTDRRESWNQRRLKLPCYQLWNYLNVTVEGYISACCSDYNNDLIVGNLHKSSLLEAWHSEEFQNLREAHIKREVKGTMCDGCIRQADTPYSPINTHLT